MILHCDFVHYLVLAVSARLTTASCVAWLGYGKIPEIVLPPGIRTGLVLLGRNSLIERVILSVAVMLIFSVSFQLAKGWEETHTIFSVYDEPQAMFFSLL